jgi:hypothetical protein
MKAFQKPSTLFNPVPFPHFFSLLLIGIILISVSFHANADGAGQDITLMWDESIDAPYLQSYRVYYYIASNQPEALSSADYATTYTLAGGDPIAVNPLTDPKPITIDKSHTQITLHFTDAQKVYYFVLTAIDTRGLESIPTPEVSSARLGIIAIHDGAAFAIHPLVTLAVTAVNPATPIAQMQFSHDGVSWSEAEAFAATKQWTLSAGDGVKTVYARFKESIGDWSSPVSASVTLDTQPPSLAIGNPSAAATGAGPVTYTLTYTGADAVTLSNAHVTLIKSGTADGTVAVSGTGQITRTVTVSNITGSGSLGISIAAGTASDLAGNPAGASGTSATFVVENAAAPIYLSSQVTAGNIPGLAVIVVNSSGAIVGVYDVADDGTWHSALMPAGQYDWYLVYGNRSSAKNATTFNTSGLTSISGTITGLPAGGGIVSVKSSEARGLFQFFQKTVSVAADGAYTVNLLPPAADYQVAVVAPDVPVTYYNNKVSAGEADNVNVSTAAATGINFTLVVPDSHIRGTIADAAGSVNGLIVYGYEVNTSAMIFTRTAADGTYDLKVRPGTYQIYLIKENGKIFYFYREDGTPTQNDAYAATRSITTAGQTIANTHINITEGSQILEGKVAYGAADGYGVANVLVAVSTATELSLGITNEDGRYTISGLRSGITYAVQMKPLSGNYPIQTASVVAGVDMTKDFVIGVGAVLSGTVTQKDSTPLKKISGAMYYIKDRQTGILIGGRVYYSGADGTYSIHDVAAGDYTLEVFHSDYSVYSANITVGASNVAHTVAMEKGASFKGAVMDESGNPLSGATILVSRTGATSVYATSNNQGRYSIYGLDGTKADYTLTVQRRDYERQALVNRQPSAAGTTVDFTLSRPAATYRVSGVVEASDQTPVSGATVLVSSKLLNYYASVTTATDGSYAVEGLVNAGNYTIAVLSSGNLPMQSNSFTVNNADVSQNFAIPLGQEIAGYIFGSTAFPAGHEVHVFIYKGTQYVNYAKAVAGTFSFTGLVEGSDYKLLATAGGYENQWFTGQSNITTANTIASGNTAVTLTLTALQ